MTELHSNHGHQATTDLLSKVCRVTEDSERRPIERASETTPPPNEISHPDWEMLAIWSFAVFSFAALLFYLWAISTKCHGDWPF